MAIKSQSPPKETFETLIATARTMPGVYGPITGMLRQVSEAPERHWPHPVYTVGLEALATEGQGLSKAHLIGWRFLVKSDAERYHAIEVHREAEGPGHRFAELDKGPFIEGMSAVLMDPASGHQLGNLDRVLTVLRINALRIFALWLQAADPAYDCIAVMAPAPPYLSPWPATYTVDQFQLTIQPEARRELDDDDDLDA